MAKTLTKCLLGDKVMHPNDFVAAIEFRGKDVTLTVKSVAHETLTMQGGVKDVKPVLTFVETKKKFICNKTNASSIALLYGTQAMDWVGKKITLYPTKTAVGKKMEDCIRVRERVPGSNAPPPSEELQRYVPEEPPAEKDGFDALVGDEPKPEANTETIGPDHPDYIPYGDDE